MQIKTGELSQVGLNTTTGTSSEIFISKHRDLVISSEPSPGTPKPVGFFSLEVTIRNLTGSSSFLFIQEMNPGVWEHLQFRNCSHVNQQQSLKLKSQIFHTHTRLYCVRLMGQTGRRSVQTWNNSGVFLFLVHLEKLHIGQ